MSTIQNNANSTVLNFNVTASPEPTTLLSDYDYDSLNDGNDIDSGGSTPNGGNNGSSIDKLPLPDFLKAFLKNLLGDSGDSGSLPSNADAARTIHDFQGEKKTGMLNSDQVKQMADTGYCKMPNGEIIQVPPDVQAAAQKMMANNGDLFKKLESAIRGSHDGLLSQEDYDAALKDGSIGKPGTADLPMTRGLDSNSFLKFVMDGTLSQNRPTEYNAAKTIHDFQGEKKTGMLNSDQVKQMADTGYCKMPNGEIIQVPPDVQAAAQKMMANNGDLFKKLESAIRGSHDGLLSQEDFDAALKDGSIGKPGTPALSQPNGSQGNTPAPAPAPEVPMSAIGATTTMEKFQKDMGGADMTLAEFKQIAETGKYTKKDGTTVDVSPEVKAAAKTFMANDAALFQKLEVASNGNNDNIIGLKDYNPGWRRVVSDSLDSMKSFMETQLGGAHISKAQIKEMVETGKVTDNNGNKIDVPAQVQEAARNFMDNGAWLFEDTEATANGVNDDLMSVSDINDKLSSVKKQQSKHNDH